MSLGPTELVIILVIVLLLFGVGRVSRIGGELGSAVANFRRGLDQGGRETPAAGGETDEAQKTGEA